MPPFRKLPGPSVKFSDCLDKITLDIQQQFLYSLTTMNEQTTPNEQVQNESLTAMLATLSNGTATTGCRFCSLVYTNQNGEKARHTIHFGHNIENLYKADLLEIELMLADKVNPLTGIDLQAAMEIRDSIQESLMVGIGNNSKYTLKGYYDGVSDNSEVKLHTDEKTGERFLYIRGYVHSKAILVEGVYPHVNSRPLTIAKQKIEKNLKRGKIRTFKINVNQLHMIKVNGLTVEIE
jgi:hypothetical protein